jgi:putative transposase
MQQCLGKQAFEIVKSQRKRKKKTKPVFTKNSLNLDERFVDFQFDNNSFDIWIRLASIGNRIQVKLPARKHKHFLHYKSWPLKKSIRLRKIKDSYFIDVYFEKQVPSVKAEGTNIGIDIGYKKLIACSNGEVYGEDFQLLYEKISRKKQGSKAFKRALKQRDNKINETVNKLSLDTVKKIVVENLKSVKTGSKGKISKKFNNKLQRWSYPKVLEKLSRLCEEKGILFYKRNPAYTSQRCSLCGVIDKSNRKGEVYQCSCGNLMDADINAAINILTWEPIVPMPIIRNKS